MEEQLMIMNHLVAMDAKSMKANSNTQEINSWIRVYSKTHLVTSYDQDGSLICNQTVPQQVSARLNHQYRLILLNRRTDSAQLLQRTEKAIHY